MVFAKHCAEVFEDACAKGIDKSVVASLVGDVQVEVASEYFYERGIVASLYTTECRTPCSTPNTPGRLGQGCFRRSGD